jgi:hypothetical protein
VQPLDSTQSQVVEGAAPYWRVGREQRWSQQSLFFGGYGINARLRPGAGTPHAGPVDRYTDVAADMQYQFIGDRHMFSVLSTFISEKQYLDASTAAGLAQNAANNLKTFKLAVEYTYRRLLAGSLGYFSTSGSRDALLYPTGNPNATPAVPLSDPDRQPPRLAVKTCALSYACFQHAVQAYFFP